MISKLLIVCGGTGGHFYPGLSIAVELSRKNGTPMLFITGRQSEQHARAAREKGIKYEILPASPVPGGLKGKAVFAFHLLKAVMESRRKLKKFAPDAMIVMGSFHSVAPALAARSLGIPLFIHDGNARVGKANLFLSRFARHMALSFPPVNSGDIRCGWTVTGMPVRQQIADCKITKAQATALLNSKLGTSFSDAVPLLLVFGGSQGAEGINQKVPAALMMQGNNAFQVVHISGPGNRENLEKAYSSAAFRHAVIEGSGEMEIFYSAADLVICRSGGSTVAELAIFAKFAIMIPYPHATDNHQEDNADHYCASGAGMKIREKDLTVNKLASTIAFFIEQPANFAAKGAAGANLAKPGASSEILQMIEKHS